MKRLTVLAILAIGPVIAALTSVLAAPDPAAERFWAQWRGPYATGVSKHANPPAEWSETKNVRWKVEIPGRGSSSPIVWGDRVFLLTAIPVGVTGPDAARAARRRPTRATCTGSPSWRSIGGPARSSGSARPAKSGRTRRTTRTTAPRRRAPRSPTASASSRGSNRAACSSYDMDGTLLWQKDLGDKKMRNQFGEGSTPVLHGNRLVIVWDHQGQSFVVALDAATGNETLARRARGDRHLGDAARRRTRRRARR